MPKTKEQQHVPSSASAAAVAAAAAPAPAASKKQKKKRKRGRVPKDMQHPNTCDQCRLVQTADCDGKSPCGNCVSNFIEKHRLTGINGVDLEKDGVGCTYDAGDDRDWSAAAGGKQKTVEDNQPHSRRRPRFRMNGGIIDLSADAIVINGPLRGTKHYGPRYGLDELCADMKESVQKASQSAERLISMSTAASGTSTTQVESQRELLVEYEHAFLSMSRSIFLLSQWKVAHDAGDIMKVPSVAPAVTGAVTVNPAGKVTKGRDVSLEDEAKTSSSISRLLLPVNTTRADVGRDYNDDDNANGNETK